MMGIGPIIIPAVFREAGIVLSAIFTIVISFISYLTCEFIVEAMSKAEKKLFYIYVCK